MDFESLSRILLIIIGIGAIIFVHEMGHFLVARLCGVRVDGFSLGFPPTGLGIRRSPEGLNVTVLPNFLNYSPLEVGGIEKGSPADRIGLALGDRILAVNDVHVDRMDYESLEKVLRDQWCCGRQASFLVDREGARMTLGPMDAPKSLDLPGFGLFPHLAAQKGAISRGQSWAHGLAADEVVRAVGSRKMLHREEFRKFASDAVARGTGIVRLHVSPLKAADEPDAPSREIVLLIQQPAQKPRVVWTLPLLKGREGRTEYRLSMIPIGGYVKMAGDAPGEGKGASDEFLQKPVGRRAAIIAAGSITNIAFALVLFVAAFQIGVRFSTPVVGSVVSGSPAQKAGLLPGDRILKIDGEVVTAFLDIPSEVAFSDPEEGAVFEIERGGEGGKQLSIRVMPEKDEEAGRLEIGIYPLYSSTVQAIKQGSPFHEAGLTVKDRIVELNGQAVEDREGLNRAFETALQSGRREFVFVVERGGELMPAMTCAFPGDMEKVWRIGISPEMRFRVKSPGPAAEPFKEGDEVFEINGAKIGLKDLAGSVEQVLGSALTGDISFGVRRAGQETILRKAFSGEADHAGFFKSFRTECAAGVLKVGEGSDYMRIGGREGDSIRKVSGRAFTNLSEMQKIIQGSGGSEVEVTWVDATGAERTGRIRPVGQLNTSLDQMGLAELSVALEDVRLPLADSIVVGFKKSLKFSADIFKMLKGIFTKKLSPKNLGGPVLIFKASYHFAEHGFGMLLFFLGILGINLGIINLFPVPILDGGHLMFLAIEKVKGSPLSEPVQIAAQYAGLLILVLLMIYVTAQDLMKLAN